ncbi:MAG TPA: outer membrane beta-barrel protein [Polyangiaceae bacterium]|nr:outer membrane beta-barrel protein [Polyangiaceae bacterium]
MARRLVFVLPVALVLLAPALARAAGEDCPDGWFCEANAAPAPPSSQPPNGPPSPRPEPSGPPAGVPAVPPAAFYPPATPPGPEARVQQADPEKEPPRKRQHRRFREWGFNLHFEGALVADQPRADSGTGGLGFGFRYRALPALAFEVGLDFLRGPEHRGYWRSEAALLLNTLVFFNPRDVVQLYALGGLGFSRTGLTYVRSSGDEVVVRESDEHQSYFGGQLGLGLEVRVSHRVAIAGDVVGFIRGRTDDDWRDSGHFISGDPRRHSDSDSGALLRAGVTFYW